MRTKLDVNRLPHVWIVVAIMALGLAARLPNINYQSLWADELHSIVAADPGKSIWSIIEYCKSDQPPVSFLYLHFVFKIFPYEDWVGRIACMVLGILSIPVMYLLGREFGNSETGVFAALLTSINYFHIYYSQELRFYTMTFLLAACSYLFFVRAMKNKELLNFILYTFFTTLLLYTHYFGLFVFGSQCLTFVFILIYKGWGRKFFFSGAISGLAAILLFLPWVPTLLSDLKITTATFWIKPPSPQFVAEYFYIYTGKDALTTGILVALIFVAYRHFRSHTISRDSVQRGLGWTLVLWIALCYLIPYIRSITGTPILHPRYTIVVLPAWLTIFAMGWSYLKDQRLKYAIPFVLILSLIVNMVFVKQYYEKVTKDQFREASEYVISNNKERWPVYAPLAWHFNFYFKDEPAKVIPLYGADRRHLDHFWMLQGHFGDDEKQAIMNLLAPDFEVVHHEKFLGADAILLKNRKAPVTAMVVGSGKQTAN